MNQRTEHNADRGEDACRLTNVEAIAGMMEFSRYGALAQLFIVDTLHKQARAVADAPPETFEGWQDGPISPEAWQGVAREIADKLDKHLGK